MKKISCVALACLVLPFLTSCLTIKVTEATVFAPAKFDLGPAGNVAELDTRMTERFKGGVDEGVWRYEALGDGLFRLSFREDFPHRQRILPPPVELRNGFIGEGAGRVAWTYFMRPAALSSATTHVRPLVVHCAGNAGDRYNSGGDYAAKALPFADVLVFDYPGYGDTPGPASAGTFEAASRVLSDYVVSQTQHRKLVLWGHSLGGFVCSRLAETIPSADGLILETTAPNAAAVAKAWTPIYARPFIRAQVAPSLAGYDVVGSAAQLKGPVLVLGATKDEVLPVTLARQIADSLKSRNANVTYYEFAQAKHMNVPAQAEFNGVIATFFKTVESQ